MNAIDIANHARDKVNKNCSNGRFVMAFYKSLAFALVFTLTELVGSAHAQPAPPLTSVQITRVVSTQGGTEDISTSQFSTIADHGGAQVRITVREIGTAQTTRIITLDGAIVSNTAVSSTNLCGIASSPTTPCTAGQTIIGFDRVYQIDGRTGGNYSVTARNNRSPFNTITDRLNIQ